MFASLFKLVNHLFCLCGRVFHNGVMHCTSSAIQSNCEIAYPILRRLREVQLIIMHDGNRRLLSSWNIPTTAQSMFRSVKCRSSFVCDVANKLMSSNPQLSTGFSLSWCCETPESHLSVIVHYTSANSFYPRFTLTIQLLCWTIWDYINFFCFSIT